tara:strand:- start:195 stop:1196 length:1002 start_codon:yes stop_codon:yes gene_type:complete
MRKFINQKFKALFVFKNKKKFNLSFKNFRINSLENNELLIKLSFTTINYKDILVCNGNPGLVRKYPHIPGIDAAGKVHISNSQNFKKGDKVFIVAQPFGINTNGSFSEYLKVNQKYVEKLPKNLALKDTMIFGTAGFTAIYSILKVLRQKIYKKNKTALVSGATGGVGSIAIFFLSKLGFKISSVTSKKNKESYLKNIGVSSVIRSNKLKNYTKLPLLRKNYSLVIDNLGGEILPFGLTQLCENGNFLLIGAIKNQYSNFSLMPFILRGVNLKGINAEKSNKTERKNVWKKITLLSKERKIKLIHKTVNFKNIKNSLNKIKKNKSSGRVVVKF